MAVDAASPTDQRPLHHLTLTDGTTRLGLVAGRQSSKDGFEPDITAIQRQQIERTAIKTYQGDGAYSDFNLPYMTLAQQDWSGGRGKEDFDEDRSRYFDGKRMQLHVEGEAFLGPMETYATGYVDCEQEMPGDDGSLGVYGTGLFKDTAFEHIATSFTLTADQTIHEVWLYVKRTGSPSDLSISVAADNAGEPDTLDETITLAASSVDENLWYFHKFAFAGTTNYSATDVVWIVGDGGGASSDGSNYWRIGAKTTGSSCVKSADGSTWSSYTTPFWYRVPEITTTLRKTVWTPFEYKRAMYAYTQPTTGNPFLWLNGDRGVYNTAGAFEASKLKDESKTWADDLYNDAVVLIINGPGSEEEQPWRNITDTVNNTNNPYLTVSPDWNKTHTTDTEYVILGSNIWKSLATWSGIPTDHAVAGDFVYFALGEVDTNNVLRYRWYNNAGTATTESLSDSIEAVHLESIRHPEDGKNYLYGSLNDHPIYGSCVWKMNVPDYSTNLYEDMGILAPTDVPWDDRDVTGVTPTMSDRGSRIFIAAGASTGIVAVKKLDQPIDIQRGNAVGFWIKATATVAATDFDLLLGDTDDLGEWRSPIAVIQQAASGPTAQTDLRLMEKLFDGDLDTEDGVGTTASRRGTQWDTDKYFYVISDKKFDEIYFDMGTSVNDAASTLSAEYFNGYIFTSWAITSDKTDDDAGGGSGTKTMTQDGYVDMSAIPEDWDPYTIIIEDEVNEYYIREFTGYCIKFKVSAALKDDIDIAEIYVRHNSTIALSVPALVANEWEYCVIAYTPQKYPLPDRSLIRSVGLEMVNDKTIDIYLRDGIHILNTDPEYKILPDDSPITNITSHSGNVQLPRKNPWVFTQKMPYEWQTQNDDIFVPLPIGELSALASETTGKAVCSNDVYLYFNLEQRIQRYFNNSLEDVGPDRDAGLPSNRRGEPKSLISYPGTVFAAISHPDNTSSIMRLDGKSWHEEYRAPTSTYQINNMALQAIPGKDVDWLWFDQAGEILHIPVVPGNPVGASDYEFTHQGWIETGWFYGGMRDVVKVWNSIKLFFEAVERDYSGDAFTWAGQEYRVDYKTDDDTSWTTIVSAFDTTPSEEQTISTTSPPNTTGRRFKMRIRAYTSAISVTPRLKAATIEAYGAVPVKNSYTLTAQLAENYLGADVQGKPEQVLGYTTAVETGMAKLEAWRDAGTQLTLNSASALYDSKTVLVKQIADRPISREGRGGVVEKHLFSLVLDDV